MNKPLPFGRPYLFSLLILALVPVLLAGCGGSGLSGGGGRNIVVEAFGLGPENYDLLTSLTPTFRSGWYTNPVETPITINQTRYEDAIKAAIYAEEVRPGILRYHLGGRYSALAVTFGITADEPDAEPNTTFRFFGDGRQIIIAHVLRRADKREFIVDVRGVQDLELTAESVPSAGSTGSTLVGWADGTLIKEAGITHLIDLTPTAETGWTPPLAAGVVYIDYRPYPQSLVGTLHKGDGVSSITYHLGGQYRKFATVAGISSRGETDSTATVRFEVLADGVSKRAATLPQFAELPVQFDASNVQTLELRAQIVNAAETDIDVGWGMPLLLEK